MRVVTFLHFLRTTCSFFLVHLRSFLHQMAPSLRVPPPSSAGRATNWTCCAHLPHCHMRELPGLFRLPSHTTLLIKLLLHSRCDALHLFNSIHHKKKKKATELCFYKGSCKIDSSSGNQECCATPVRAHFHDLLICSNNQSPQLWKISIPLISSKLDWMGGLATPGEIGRWVCAGAMSTRLRRTCFAQSASCAAFDCGVVRCPFSTDDRRSRRGLCARAPVRGAARADFTGRAQRWKLGEEHGFKKSGGCYQRYWSWLTRARVWWIPLLCPCTSLSLSHCLPLSLSLSIRLILGYRLHYGQSTSIVSLNKCGDSNCIFPQ